MIRESPWIGAVVNYLQGARPPGSLLSEARKALYIGVPPGTPELLARRDALASMPFEAASFQVLYQVPRIEFQDRLSAYCSKVLEAPGLLRPDSSEWKEFGYIGLLLLSILTLEDADERRFEDIADRPEAIEPGADQRKILSKKAAEEAAKRSCARRELAGDLVRNPAVAAAIHELYQPDFSEDDASSLDSMTKGKEPADKEGRKTLDRLHRAALANEFWGRLSLRRYRFHRFGTTSFILREASRRGRAETQSSAAPIALKLVLLPYAELPVIASATREYAHDYGAATDSAHAVSVLHSSARWIAMEYVDGVTLGELLSPPGAQVTTMGPISRRNRAPWDRGRYARGRALIDVGPLLFDALADMNEREIVHSDLNPSNIIVSQGAEPKVTFIDFGRNYLYGQSGLGRQASDARYVAPEVRQDDHPSWRADVYSLGQLIIGLAAVGREGESVVPDAFYRRTYALARFLEDLIDEDPDGRLIMFRRETHDQGRRTDGGDPTRLDAKDWVRLKDGYTAAVRLSWDVDRYDGLFGPPSVGRRLLLDFAPNSASPGRLSRLRRELKKSPVGKAEGSGPGEVASSLMWWSRVSAASWYLVVLVTVYLVLRDLNVLPGGRVDQLLSLLRTPSYREPPESLEDTLPARISLISMCWASVKYYQNIYAGLTTRGVTGMTGWPGVVRRAAEFINRVNTFLAPTVAVLVNLIAPGWWAVSVTLLLANSLAVNFFGRAYTGKAVDVSREEPVAGRPRNSAVPERVVGLEKYRPWTPSMAAFLLICAGFATLIDLDVLEDTIAYATVVAVVTVGLLTFTKCGTDADIVRIGITRGYLAAERLQRKGIDLGARPAPRSRRARGLVQRLWSARYSPVAQTGRSFTARDR